jgi:hypothetical protein
VAAEEKVLPEVKFDGVRLEDVVDFLQDVSNGKYRAVVVHRGNAEGPMVTMRLKNVSIAQIMNVLVTAYPGIEIVPVDGPTGPVHVITISPAPGQAGAPGGGEAEAGVELERAVRVYRLAGIVDGITRPGVAFSGPAARDSKEAKEALNNVLSLIKATVQLTSPREAPTLQVHEETQTLIFKGSPQQRQAIEDVLAALESNKAVRPEKVSDQTRLMLNDAKAELDRAKADAERARREADSAREEAMKRAQMADLQVQEMNARLRDVEAVKSRLEAELRSKMAEGAAAHSARDEGASRLGPQIDAIRARLAQAQSKLGADHPEVQKLKAELERLEKMQADEKARQTTPGK